MEYRIGARATRYFWGWLIVVTSVSIAGNVTHAFLKAPPGARVLAAAAALVTGIQRYQNDPNSGSRDNCRFDIRTKAMNPKCLGSHNDWSDEKYR